MSRIGKHPIVIPAGVKVALGEGVLSVEGPKGNLRLALPPRIRVTVEDGKLVCRRPSDDKRSKSLHGLTRTLVANLVEGVTKGFQKKLELVGIGYRAAIQAGSLVLHAGFSHPIAFPIPPGIRIEVENQTVITVSGADKQQVGQVAATIRAFRKPEPYKGKGIKYSDEVIRRKAGKTGA